jgi:hypothetical protein
MSTINRTPFAVEVVPMIDQDGRNIAVVIAKGTYEVRGQGDLALAPEQDNLVFADEYVGEPGKSDVRIPSDFVDFKPTTDVVLIRPSSDLEQSPLSGRRIAVEVGPVKISGRVGRTWEFGPLRRDEGPRKRYAGTYDQDWVENRMPLLPADFDPRHNQVAPPGQIAPGYLDGSELVRLTNLYSDGVLECQLPGRALIVSGNVLGHYFTEVAVLDTVLIWSDRPWINLVWRHVIHVRQKIAEVSNVFIDLVRLRTARELYGAP